MNLIPWRNRQRANGGTRTRELVPASPLELRTELDRLFDRFFSGDWDWNSPLALASWQPAVDVTEDEKEVTVRAEIPGVDPKDIDLTVSGNLLSLSAEKKEEHEEKERGLYWSERRHGSCRRTLQLPPYVKADQVDAQYKNGVLTIHLPKDEAARGKRVPVKSSNRS